MVAIIINITLASLDQIMDKRHVMIDIQCSLPDSTKSMGSRQLTRLTGSYSYEKPCNC